MKWTKETVRILTRAFGFSAARAASTLVAIALLSGMVWAQELAKEYVYVGGRLLAVEVPAGAPPGTVMVTPESTALTATQTQQFSADVAVTWSVAPADGLGSSNIGGIDASGLYAAPSSITAARTLTVTATPVSGPLSPGEATVQLHPIVVSVTPATATLSQGAAAQFAASVTGTANQSVTWSIEPAGVGSINSSGLYTAPTPISLPQTVAVIATSAEDGSSLGQATVTLQTSGSGGEEESELSIIDLTIVPNDSALQGSTISVDLAVQLMGPFQVSGAQIDFYFSTDTTIGAGDTLVGTYVFPHVLHSSSTPVETEVTVPTTISGSRYFIAYAHYQPGETPTLDNTAWVGPIDITAPPPPGGANSDLLIFDINVPAQLTTAETPPIVQAAIANYGEYFENTPFWAAIQVASSPGSLPPCPSQAPNNYLFQFPASYAWGYSWNRAIAMVPQMSFPAGTYWVDAYADCVNDVSPETNENNNGKQVTFQVITPPPTPPDLTFNGTQGNLVLPAVAAPGQQINVEATFENTSTAISQAFTVGIYLSQDDSITTADERLGGCNYSSLAQGAAQTCGLAVQIPSSLVPGYYYLGAFLDEGAAISESFETNNNLAEVIQIGTPGSNEPPLAVSVTPNDGGGSSQTFSYLFSDANGFGDINSVQIMINDTLNSVNSCQLYYVTATNNLYIRDDTNSTWLGPATPGASTTLENSQCIADVAATSISGSGDELTFNAAITFKAAFAGAKNNYMVAYDDEATAWQQKGTWTVANNLPVAVSVTPSSGTGSSETFSYLFSDADGFTDVNSVQVMINNALNSVNSCQLYYVRTTNQLHLRNDAHTAWIGPVTPGTSTTLENSQCIVDVAATSVSGSGDELTLTAALTFTTAFAGAKNNYMVAYDDEATSWQQKGTWTVANNLPVAVSVTPSSGTGSSETFSYLFSDADGFADINSAQIMINNALNSVNSCQLYYIRTTNQLHLRNDANTAWIGPVAPGASTILENGQCIADVGATSVSGSGDELTFTVALTFKAAFAGAKNNYMVAYDDETTSWQQKGTWTVANNLPVAVSVTPSSGSGSSQTFSYLFSDADGFPDINSVQIMINNALNSVNSCQLYYVAAANQLYLRNDAHTAWIGPATPGASTTLENSQCIADVATTSVSGSGDELTFVVPLTFKTAFVGSKNNYMVAYDDEATAWQQKGTWTVP